eukprot:1106880-Pelagomonas_calceolata.AAC.4
MRRLDALLHDNFFQGMQLQGRCLQATCCGVIQQGHFGRSAYARKCCMLQEKWLSPSALGQLTHVSLCKV